MDERQQQIKAGAGLEESRINQDLIDFLQKWGSWILMALAAAALIYAGLGWLERQRVAKVNEAFAALEGARAGANPNPDALRRVADEYEGVKSVAELARLETADILLHAARVGVRPGAQINADGSVGQIDAEGNVDSAGELLSDEERGRYLDQAESLYAAVLETTLEKPGKAALAMNARFGLAAVYESRGEADRARGEYEATASLAESAALPAAAALARARAEVLTTEAPAALLSADQLPELPTPPEPEPIVPEGGESGIVIPPMDLAPGEMGGEDAGSDTPADESTEDAPTDGTIDEDAADEDAAGEGGGAPAAGEPDDEP